jgi:hypothetical protein
MQQTASLAYTTSQEDSPGKMPHERDESVDAVIPPPEPEMKQASIDVTRGMVDTDRGAAMNVTYKEQKKPGG